MKTSLGFNLGFAYFLRTLDCLFQGLYKKNLLKTTLLLLFALTVVSCGDDDGEPKPSIKIIGLEDESTPKKSHTWNWSCDQKNCTFRYAINRSETHTFDTDDKYKDVTTATQGTGDGTYYIHVQAINTSGGLSEVTSASAILDNTPPPPPTNQLFTTPVTSNRKVPRVIASGLQGGDVIQIYDTQDCTSQPVGSGKVGIRQTSITLSLKALKNEGSYSYYARITDLAGNTSRCSVSVVLEYILDLTPPQVTGLTPDPQPAPLKKWQWGCNEDFCVYRHTITRNSSHRFKTTDRYRSTTTAEQTSGTGTYYIHVQAKDKAGNESQVKSVSFTIDTNAFAVTGLVNETKPKKSHAWTWGCGQANCTYRYKITQQDFFTFSQESFSSATTASTSSLGSNLNGKYYIHVQARNVAGQISDTAKAFAILDNTPPTKPVLSVVSRSPSDNRLPRIAISNVSAGDQVTLYRGTSCTGTPQGTKTVPANATAVEIIAKELPNTSGTYYYYAKSQDIAGNVSPCSDAVSYVLNVNFIVTGLTPDQRQRSTKTWQWGCSKNGVVANCTYRHVVNQNASYIFPSSAGYNSITTTTISVGTQYPAGTYYIHVQARDTNNMESPVKSVSVVLSTSGTGLEVTGISPDNTPRRSKTWNWNCTNNSGTCTYRHVVNQSSTHTFVSSAGYNSTTTKTIQMGSTYGAGRWYLHVQAKDSSGGESPVKSVSVTLSTSGTGVEVTGISPDSTPRRSKTWNWNCTNNSGTCTYRHVVNQGSTYNFPSSASYNSTRTKTINLGSTYGAGRWYLHVQAKDSSGGESAVKTVSVTLSASGTGVEVTGISPDSTSRQSKEWNWGCTNNSGACTYRHVVNQNSTHTFVSSVSYNSTTRKEIRLGSTHTAGKWYLHVQTKDSSGGESAVKTVYVTLSASGSALEVTGIRNETTPKQSQTWNWNCTNNSGICTYRHAVNQNATYSFPNSASYNSTKTKTIRVGSTYTAGKWYLHVQARDASGTVSDVKKVSVTLNASGPELEVDGLSHDTSNPISKTWRWHCLKNGVSGTCIYRHVVNTSPSHTFTDETFVATANRSITTRTHSAGTTYYIHVQAKENISNIKSPVKSVSVTLRGSGLMITNLLHNDVPSTVVCFPTTDQSDSCSNTATIQCSYGGRARTCKYRWAVSRNATYSFNSADRYVDISNEVIGFSLSGTSSNPSDSLTRSPGIYYVHVQALDDGGNNDASDDLVSSVKSVYGILSTTFDIHEYTFHSDDESLDSSNCPSGINPIKVWDTALSKCKRQGNVFTVPDNIPEVALSKTWHWDCSYDKLVTNRKTCSFRFVVNQNPSHTFTNEAFSSIKTTTKTIINRSDEGIYYLHVQSKDSDSNYSSVHSTAVTLKFDAKPLLTSPPPTPCHSSDTNCESGKPHDLQLHRGRNPVFQVSGLASGEKIKLYPRHAITIDNTASPKTCTMDEAEAISTEGTIVFGQASNLKITNALTEGVHKMYVGIKDSSQSPAVVKCALSLGYNGTGNITHTLVASTEYVVYRPLVVSKKDTCYLFNNNKGNTTTTDRVGQVKCWGSNSLSLTSSKFIVAGNDFVCGVDNSSSSKDKLNCTDSNLKATGDDDPDVKFVTAGSGHVCIMDHHQSVRCWGDNASGQLGIEGTSANTNKDPVDLGCSVGVGCSPSSDTAFTAKTISAGSNHTCAILNNDRVKCWGANQVLDSSTNIIGGGQLGQNHTNNIGDDSNEMGTSLGFTLLEDSSSSRNVTVKAISAGGNHTCAILSNNLVKCWGHNDKGQLGQNNINRYGTATTRTTNNNGTDDDTTDDFYDESMSSLRVISGLSNVKSISAGYDYSCAVFTNDTMKCWGGNDTGQLGQNDTIEYGDVSSTTRIDHDGDTSTPKILVSEPLSRLGFINLGCSLTGQSSCPSANRYKVEDGLIATTGFVNTESIDLDGDSSSGDDSIAVDLTGGHTCAVLKDTDSNTDLQHVVKCWGLNNANQLKPSSGAVSRGWSDVKNTYKIEQDGSEYKVQP